MKKTRELFVSFGVIALGLVPALAFFIWIERNMALPWVGTWIGWPWLFIDAGVLGSVLFNLGLIAIFGTLHSLLAGRAPRAVYTIVAGLTSLFTMAAWQPTGVLLYQLIPSAIASSIVSFTVYWALMAFAAASLARVEAPARFLGVAPASPPSSVVLWTKGLYARVRHPVYTLTFAAWILTPLMSLDRLVFIFGMAVYLSIAIRNEERRLVAEFGEAYRTYQRTTPQFLPGRSLTRS